MVSGALWGVAQAAQTSILGHISAEAIAANSIAVVIFQIFAGGEQRAPIPHLSRWERRSGRAGWIS